MNGDNQELTGYERYGRLARQAYAGASLSRNQRDRHLARLAETGRRRQDVSNRFRSHASEFAAIAAVLLVAVALVAIWQVLGFPSDNDAASLPTATSQQPTPEPTMESGAAVLTPTITQENVTVEPQGSPTVTTSADVDSCPVTPYSSGQPAADAQAAFTDTWIGEDGGLWAGLGLENEGVWSANNQLRVLWWHAGFDPATVTGERLDSEAPALEVEYHRPLHLITFPTPGCWEIIGQAGDLDLSFVVEVVPREQNPQEQDEQERIAQLEQERQQLRPQPVPETCQVTGWAGPDFRVQRSDYYAYWLEGDGLALGKRHGVLFAGDNDVGWLAGSGLSTEEAVSGQIEITGERLDGDTSQPVSLAVGTQISANIITDDSVERGWEATLTFPEPGCWSIQAQIGPNTLNATVYVYPDEDGEAGVPLDDVLAVAESLEPGEARHYALEIESELPPDESSFRHWRSEVWERVLADGTHQARVILRNPEGNTVTIFIRNGDRWWWNQRGWVESGTTALGIVSPDISMSQGEPFALAQLINEQGGWNDMEQVDEVRDGDVLIRRYSGPLEDGGASMSRDLGINVARFVYEIRTDTSTDRALQTRRILIDEAGQEHIWAQYDFLLAETLPADSLDSEQFAIPEPSEESKYAYTPPDQLPLGLDLDYHRGEWGTGTEDLSFSRDGLTIEVRVSPSRGGFDPRTWKSTSRSDIVFHTTDTAAGPVTWIEHDEYGWPRVIRWDDGRYRFRASVTSEPAPDVWTEDDLVTFVEALSGRQE